MMGGIVKLMFVKYFRRVVHIVYVLCSVQNIARVRIAVSCISYQLSNQVYICLLIHAIRAVQNRGNAEAVDALFKLSLGMGYTFLLQIHTTLENSLHAEIYDYFYEIER